MSFSFFVVLLSHATVVTVTAPVLGVALDEQYDIADFAVDDDAAEVVLHSDLYDSAYLLNGATWIACDTPNVVAVVVEHTDTWVFPEDVAVVDDGIQLLPLHPLDAWNDDYGDVQQEMTGIS
jgi:hypothetical protein